MSQKEESGHRKTRAQEVQIVHSGTMIKILVRRKERIISGRQFSQKDSKLRIPRTTIRQSKSPQKMNFRCASFRRRGVCRSGVNGPFVHIDKDGGRQVPHDSQSHTQRNRAGSRRMKQEATLSRFSKMEKLHAEEKFQAP